MNNMNYSIFRFTLNMHSHRSQASIPVKKFDTAVRFYITITDGGLPYTIEDGCMAVFRGKKADDTVLINYCRIENGIVVYDFTEQTTSCTGIINCQIDLMGIGGRKIASPTFVIVVDDNVVYDKDIITSYDEKNALDGLLESAENAKFYAGVSENHSEYAYGSALKAEGYALGTHGGSVVDSTSPYHENNAKYYAESASASAKQASSNELASRQNMDTAISKAEDAKDSAGMAEECAQDALQYKNEASETASEIRAYADAQKVDRVTDIKLDYNKTTHQVVISLWGVKSDGSEGVIGTIQDFDLPLEAIKIAEVDDQVRDDGVRVLTITFDDGTVRDFELDEIFSGLNELVSDKVDTVTFDKKVTELEDALGTKSRIVRRVYDEDSGQAIDEFIEELNINDLATKDNIEAVNNNISEVDTNVRELSNEVNDKCIGKRELITATRNYGSGKVFATTDNYSDYRQYVVAGGYESYSLALRQENGVLNVGTPTIASHAAPRSYVDNAIAGATLEFFEDTDTAWDKSIPEGVKSNAILNSIGGATEQGDEGLFHAPVTSITSVNTSGMAHQEITIPSTLIEACGEDYGKEYTTLDFDKKQFVNDGASIVLDGVTTTFNTITPISSLGLNACVFNFSSSKKPAHSYESLIVSQPFKASASQKVNNCYFLPQYNQLVIIPSEYFETVDDANKWLQSNPIEIRYRTAVEPTVIDLSAHLTDYTNFKTISVVGGGGIQFNNANFLAVPSTITYLRRKS